MAEKLADRQRRRVLVRRRAAGQGVREFALVAKRTEAVLTSTGSAVMTWEVLPKEVAVAAPRVHVASWHVVFLPDVKT